MGVNPVWNTKRLRNRQGLRIIDPNVLHALMEQPRPRGVLCFLTVVFQGYD